MKMRIYQKFSKVISMKKVIIISLICFLMITSASSVKAQLIDFDNLKGVILIGLNRVIGRIDKLENRISNNPRITETTRQSILESLDILEDGLISYRGEVKEAKTLKKLREANQKIVKYLWDNRKVLRENIEKAIIDMANEASRKAEEFKENVKQALKILKVVCPAEKETISKVEVQISELENRIDNLKQAIRSRDIITIRNEVKEINQLMKDIRSNLKKIEESCFQ
jgi:hypothetical protein